MKMFVNSAYAQKVLLGSALLLAISLGHWVPGMEFSYTEPAKQLGAMSALLLALLVALFIRPASHLPSTGVLLLPFLATLPGAFLHQWQWNYNIHAEWINTGLAFAWVLLWTQLWKDTQTGIRWAVLLLVAGVLMTLSWSAAQWIFVEKFNAVPATNFGNQNHATNFLILIFPFILALAQQRTLGRYRFWIGLAVAVVLSLVVMLQTRAALMGWALSSYLALGLWMWTGKHRRLAWFAWWLLPVLFIIAVSLLALFYWELADRFRLLQLAGPHAWYSRTFPWMVGWQSVLDSLWLGHGPGASWSLFHGFIDKLPETTAVASATDYQHIHNEYLEWLQEGGILGLLTYLTVWGWIIWTAIRIALNTHRDTADRLWAGAAAYGLLAYHLHSSVELAARAPANRMALFVVGAIVLMLASRRNAEEEPVALENKRVSYGNRISPVIVVFLAGFSLWNEIPRQRDVFMTRTSPEFVAQSPYWRHRIDHESTSVEALYRRVLHKLHKQKEPEGTAALLDKMERLIPGFREEKFLRFFLYLIEKRAGGPDPEQILLLLKEMRNGNERYLPQVDYFSAQYAAHSQQPELLLEVLEDRLFRMGLSARIAMADRRKGVRVRVDPEGNEFSIVYDGRSELALVMGLPQLRMLMEMIAVQMDEDAVMQKIASVPTKIRARQELTGNLKDALEGMVWDYLHNLAFLARPPSPAVFRQKGCRFFFSDGISSSEPLHIHVRCHGAHAKFWIDPVVMAENSGFPDHEIVGLTKTVNDHRTQIKRAWRERK